MIRRLDRPALVLTPTLAIRDQWIVRLRDFLPEGSHRRPPPWVSRTIDDPRHLTVVTYQAVLARHRREGTVSEQLKRAGLGTLVLDEAHHLTQEWWRILSQIVDQVPGMTLVSLTATPPYDSTGREWLRYEELCGPIDDEISVPELVKAGTLAPHQDFVYLVSPTDEESRSAADYDRTVDEALQELAWDEEFLRSVEEHPWVLQSKPESILDDPELAVSLLVVLKGSRSALPETLLELLDLEARDIPSASRRWWQIVLHAYLFGASFGHRSREHRDALAARLREKGLLWRRELRIDASRPIRRTLALSAAKVGACSEIYRAEWGLRGAGLRQVVLTDFIRDEGWDAGPGVLPTELGALPVFDRLAGELIEDAHRALAMVTGRLSVVHESRLEAFRAALPADVSLVATPAPARPGWLRVEGPPGSALVAAFTRLLADGELRVLVGTRSLLGEGWDAPCVNSVVLASYVGSFVSTNQMRGRGIRTDPADPHKVASIWHVAALQPDTGTGVVDFEQLRERFRTFVGLSADGHTIESGLDRLRLPPVLGEAAISGFNAESLERHRALADVRSRWEHAVRVNETGRVIPTLQAAHAPREVGYHTYRTLRCLLYETLWVGLGGVGWRLVGLTELDGVRALGGFIVATAAVGFVRMLPSLFRAGRLLLRHLPVDGTISRMGQAVLEGLVVAGLVDDSDGLEVRAHRTRDGGVTVHLRGGSFYEQTLFADSMNELLGAIENPRYLITREATAWTMLRAVPFVADQDVHAVPSVLAVNKSRAEGFLAAWRRNVTPGELVFTRREGGRRLLLAARARSFSTNWEGSGASRLDRWS